MATSSKVKREQDKNKEEPRKPSTCPEQDILRKDKIGPYALISPWSLGSASAGSECQDEVVNGLAKFSRKVHHRANLQRPGEVFSLSFFILFLFWEFK